MPLLTVAFHFCRKLTCSEQNTTCLSVCCALRLSWDMLIRSTLTAHITTNQGDWKMTVDAENRSCSFIRSLPTGIYQPCVCVHTCQCFFQTWHHVCRMNTAQWLVCEVNDRFIMASAHRETAASRQRREEDEDMRQARFTVRPVHVNSAVCGREGREYGGQLLSPLTSLRFFHQLSIYRTVLHSCTPSTPVTHKHTHRSCLVS